MKRKIFELSKSHNDDMDSSPSRTELDSHANMMVCNDDCHIFDSIYKRSTDVEPFDPSLGLSTKVPIVDVALAFDCLVTGQTTVLLARNVLYVPTIRHNLVSLFILREAGGVVNDVPKIHTSTPTKYDHSIIFDDANLNIPLHLNGIFSYFLTRKPTLDEIKFSDKAFITPDTPSWDPYSTHYQENESALTDWEGNIIEKQYVTKYLIDDNSNVACNKIVGQTGITINPNAHKGEILDPINEKTSIEHTLQIHDLSVRLMEQLEISKNKISIGSTVATTNNCELFYNEFIGDLDANIEIHSMSANKPTTMSAEFLSKIWNIDVELAKKALHQNTHLNRRDHNNDLTRMFNTNDRMLRYKRI